MNHVKLGTARVIAMSVVAALVASCAGAQTVQRAEDFSSDPGWEGRNNVPPEGFGKEVMQDFGYSATNYAGGQLGEIGGRVNRSLTPATYAAVIEEKTLEDRLEVSGSFAVKHSEGGSGTLFGWFNSASRGWRTPNSLAIRIDGESNAVRVFFEYGTQTLNTGGGQTFEGPYQTTKTPMIPADGARHEFHFVYDPLGAAGLGELMLELDGKTYAAAMEPGHREAGAVFNRFGIFNQQISGDYMEVYFDDIVVNGKAHDFAMDPAWESAGSRTTFTDRALRPIHDFGYRTSSHAGGEPGELGGLLWRIESVEPQQAAYYGDPIGRLSMDVPLEASGRVSFELGAADSCALLGWFNPLTAIGGPPDNFLGIMVEGPSRVGHYFRPVLCNSEGKPIMAGEGPVIRQGQGPQSWTLRYTPGEKSANGKIEVTLGEESVFIDVPPEVKKGNSTFTHFGMVTWHRGGNFVDIYFDDISYTARESGK